jgi:carboxypeptidase C (cathepsin A)
VKAFSVAIASVLMAEANAKPAEELVTELPLMGTFDYGVYSGFVPINGTSKQNHYLLVESQNDWATDPLIIWTNGGPGCSSLLGWATENGPWLQPDNSTEFFENPHSWNKNASVLYVEHPAGVGYSYCDPAIPADCKFDDLTDSEDNLALLVEWFAKYPEYKNHDLWISGESYGGIYVPYWMWQIDNWNNNVTTPQDDHINLKGIMVGNGVTNWTYDTMPATLTMGYYHALYNDELHDKMEADKCDYAWIEFNDNQTAACMGYLDEFNTLIEHVDIYNIFKPVYPGDLLTTTSRNKLTLKAKQEKKPLTKADYTPWAFHGKQTTQRLRDPNAFLNRTDVRTALHINETIQEWTGCKNGIDYTMFAKGSQWIWEELKGKYRMLKFSGDIDACVPTTGSLGWINALGWDVKEAWRQYQVDGQVGGWIQEFDGLTFATVNGAGHMVPEDKPEAAMHLIFNWLNNTPI